MKTSPKILVIDDSEGDNFLTKRIFSKSEKIKESDLYFCLNGKEALEFLINLNNKHPDDLPKIILLDINMPIMDGFEFLEKFNNLRETEKFINSSIILMLTSSQNEEDKKRVEKYSFVKGFFNKPLLKEMAEDLLEKYL
ncbi:MAG: response regulator [Leptospiraceae bacterium]|nr:response regulator [Leptospiraceae bacterium]